ncbi:Do family serine endopeptidase [Rhizosaccharibacter radicis]|uniref:Probable periplasmic serine endoprotease DegP-like n=1 Tax=Rhizosaccharibacter radicis TaxID=2782605 RepID=A0ABT1VSL2_9PROT|nr:Do family serine endopeptidase [Acetobacteraceae bacterium KSS12]
MSFFPPHPRHPSSRPSRLRSRLGRGGAVALLATTTLGGFAAGSIWLHDANAVAQTSPGAAGAGTTASGAIQPTGPAQRLPDFTQLVRQVKPAVVSITSTIKADEAEDDNGGGGGGGMQGQQMPFPFPFPFQMMPQNRQHRTVEARGSGFIISADGYIVTNNHVVKGATAVSITLDDGTTLKAKVVGHDPKTDLALLKVSSKTKLPFIELGESNDVQVGQWVIAVGNPYGLGGTVTAGIVSARGRDIGEGPYDSFIQVDAPINRGNSGGPLFTQDGKVVGVNTAILSESGGSVGIGFAIPSDTVRDVVSQLRKTGHVTRGYLGVSAQQITPTMAKAMNLPMQGTNPAGGALVASVNPDSPADKAGVKPGDVITELNGQKVDSPRDLAIKVAGVTPDSKITLKVLRNGSTQTLNATIANLGKADAGGKSGGGGGNNGSLGVGLSALTPDMRQQLGVDDNVRGAVVTQVRPGSAAEGAGIRRGDVIVGVGNRMVANPRETVDAVHAALSKGDVALRIVRDGQMLFVAVSPGDGGSGSGDDSGNNDDSGSGGDSSGDNNDQQG